MSLEILTYSSMGEGVAAKLINSASLFGYGVRFFGKDEWFRNFRQIKIDLLLQAITESEADYVMYTDAPDSWFLRGDLFEVYQEFFGNSVVISGNRDHYPATDLYTRFPINQISSFEYICSSQFIGPRKKLIKILQTMQQKYNGFTDQEGWHVLMVNKWADFQIDKMCHLFLNMTGVDGSEIDTDWRLKETNTYPCSIHFGGPKGDSPNAKLMEETYQRWLNTR